MPKGTSPLVLQHESGVCFWRKPPAHSPGGALAHTVEHSQDTRTGWLSDETKMQGALWPHSAYGPEQCYFEVKLPDTHMIQRSSPQHLLFPGTITSCNSFLCKLESLPPCQQQDCVSQVLVAAHFHKHLHERCNIPCGFCWDMLSGFPSSEQQTGSFLGGWLLGYSLFDIDMHVGTISTQLWKRPWGTTPQTPIAARHLAVIKVWFNPLKNPFFPLSIIKYRESEHIWKSHHLHVLLKGFRKDKNIFSCTDVEVSAGLLKPHLYSQESRSHLVTNVKQCRSR